MGGEQLIDGITDMFADSEVISVGGLLTARVCQDHFERVIIVEPEAWVSTEEGCAVHSWTQSQIRSRLIQYQSLQGVLLDVIWWKYALTIHL